MTSQQTFILKILAGVAFVGLVAMGVVLPGDAFNAWLGLP